MRAADRADRRAGRGLSGRRPTARPVAPGARTILALGGHEFSRKRGNEALRDYMLALADGPRPKVCLLPTASGDPADQIAAFRASLGGLQCELSHVSLFRLETEAVDLADHLLAQDLIYVGGGSMLNLLAIWRAHGIDDVLRRCWERGVVMVGQSAGAMCWFEWGITRSAGSARRPRARADPGDPERPLPPRSGPSRRLLEQVARPAIARVRRRRRRRHADPRNGGPRRGQRARRTPAAWRVTRDADGRAQRGPHGRRAAALAAAGDRRGSRRGPRAARAATGRG